MPRGRGRKRGRGSEREIVKKKNKKEYLNEVTKKKEFGMLGVL